MKLLEAKSISLKHYLSLSNGTLCIPYSQRPYEWGKDQVKRLFNDLYSVHADPNSKHVLNFITVYEEDTNKYIYDGQQRSVSVILLICTLIKKLKDIGENSIADSITSEFIYTIDWSTDSENYKIIFEKDTANNIFRKYISKGIRIPDELELTDYEKSMKYNYELFETLLDEKLGLTPSFQELRTMVKNIVTNVMLILLETSSEEIAIKMFDTLNSTGQQLADFYVLKNTLVRVLGEDNVKEIWETVESNTDGLNKNKFLSSYVNAINGKTPEKNLYQKICKNRDIEEIVNARLTLQELEKASNSFLSMDTPRQRSNGTEQEQIEFSKLINTLKIAKAVQYKPVIISMDIRNFSLRSINTVLKNIISLQFRNIFIAQEPSNTVEKFYPDLAKGIYNGNITSAEEVVEKINEAMVSDTKLLEGFNNKSVKTRNDEIVFRYILREIYNYENTEIEINPDTMAITLEHILPKNPDAQSEWFRTFRDEENRKSCTYSLGNITLLLGVLNSAARNRDFAEKIDLYNQSIIPQNNKISRNNQWTELEINSRTHELYNTFKMIWKKTI